MESPEEEPLISEITQRMMELMRSHGQLSVFIVSIFMVIGMDLTFASLYRKFRRSA